MQRLSQLKVGSGTPASIFDRSYSYDNVANVSAITDNKLSPTQVQNFTYDHRDRLTQAWTTGNSANAYNQSYSYSAIGNLLSKTGVGTYTYPASGPTSVRPHTQRGERGDLQLRRQRQPDRRQRADLHLG